MLSFLAIGANKGGGVDGWVEVWSVFKFSPLAPFLFGTLTFECESPATDVFLLPPCNPPSKFVG